MAFDFNDIDLQDNSLHASVEAVLVRDMNMLFKPSEVIRLLKYGTLGLNLYKHKIGDIPVYINFRFETRWFNRMIIPPITSSMFKKNKFNILFETYRDLPTLDRYFRLDTIDDSVYATVNAIANEYYGIKKFDLKSLVFSGSEDWDFNMYVSPDNGFIFIEHLSYKKMLRKKPPIQFCFVYTGHVNYHKML